MPTHRLDKINELIKQEIGSLLISEINLPTDYFVTITKVITSADLGQSKVLVSILPTDKNDQIISQLNNEAGHFRYLLGQRLVIRKIPKLIYSLDISQQKITHVDELIDKIHKEK